MVPIMGRKKLSTEEKSRALTMIQCRFSITRVAADLHISRQALRDLKRAAARLPSCRTLPRKVGHWTQEEDHSKDGCTHAARCNERPINNGCSTEKKACTTSTERVCYDYSAPTTEGSKNAMSPGC